MCVPNTDALVPAVHTAIQVCILIVCVCFYVFVPVWPVFFQLCVCVCVCVQALISLPVISAALCSLEEHCWTLSPTTFWCLTEMKCQLQPDTPLRPPSLQTQTCNRLAGLTPQLLNLLRLSNVSSDDRLLMHPGDQTHNMSDTEDCRRSEAAGQEGFVEEFNLFSSSCCCF